MGVSGRGYNHALLTYLTIKILFDNVQSLVGKLQEIPLILQKQMIRDAVRIRK